MIEIDGYADIEQIGRGGLGDVYRATRISTGAPVAIKVLRDVSDESVAWHRTRRELTALVALAGHANVIQLLEVLDLPDGPALVMEYAPGGSVAELMLRRDHPLAVGETVLVGRQTATALVAAHAQGIVHRDVKPQNLLIDAYGQVKLCDFGIAAMTRTAEFQARTSAVSMRYASPEDLDDEVEVGPASDIYSLGATMLHLARGAPPTLRERMAPWQPPSTDDVELAALDSMISACLQPDPGDRPTASEVADELERLGWSIDERNRSLAFDPADLGTPSAGFAGPVTDDDPTVRRRAPVEQAAAVSPPDDTVYRTDRRDPQPSPSARRRWPFVVIGVAAVIAAMWLLLGALTESDDPEFEIVDRPADLVTITDLDWPLGEVGECLVQVGEQLEPVSCSEPHDVQRISVGVLDQTVFGPDAPYDREAVERAVRATCADEIETGVDVDDGSLSVPFSLPSAESWASEDDRTYQCLVGVEGRRLVGDVVVADR